MSITPRERVLLALAHQEADRVPLSLWGSWYGVTDKLYFNVLQTLGWAPRPPFRPDRVHSVNYYDDRLLEKLQVDVRHVDPGAIAATARTRADGSDGFGLEWDTGGLYRTARYHPLAKATLSEIKEFPFPPAEQTIQTGQILARLDEIKALDQEYAIIGRAVASYGFFEMAQSLRRHEQLFVDLVMAPEIVEALVQRLFDCYAAMTLRFLEVAGDRLDLIELPGDDFAGNKNTMISLEMYDQYFKEPYRRFISLIKNHSPHLKVVYHSDGAMTPFMSRLIDIGADVFHGVEPLPATDLAALKAEYGDRLTFMGGIDIRAALQGDEARVVTEVQTRLRQLGAGGGYILAPANHIQWDVPPQNLFKLYEAAREYGQYPLKIDEFPLEEKVIEPAGGQTSARRPRPGPRRG
ncbi:MAG: uroporphyrinogen decarboxylase family protein [Chloroflexota bacterium]